MCFADKRADFHRFAKDLEDAVGSAKKKLRPTASSADSVALRSDLLLLAGESRNLLFCAQTEGVAPTQRRLADLLCNIDTALEQTEAVIVSKLPKVRPAIDLTKLATRLLGTPTSTGMSLAETESGSAPMPIAYAHYANHIPNVPHYSIWMTPSTRRIATGFILFPHCLTAWSQRCSSQEDALAHLMLKMAQDNITVRRQPNG